MDRIKLCMDRILLREQQCVQEHGDVQYELFVRIRPDFFALSTLQTPRMALTHSCLMVRFRSATSIKGLTSDHMSSCLCAGQCCNLFRVPRLMSGFVVDDMVAVAPRKLALAAFMGRGRNTTYPPPTGWPVFVAPEMWENTLTKEWLQQGIPICPLAFRGLPMGSIITKTHLNEAKSCKYAEGGRSIPQVCTRTKNVPKKMKLAGSVDIDASRLYKLTWGHFLEM